MEPVRKWDATSYAEELAANIRGARARAGVSQADLAARMTALGFRWAYQTVGKTEHATRPVTAAEIAGLALALETTVPILMRAAEGDHLVTLPGLPPGTGASLEPDKMNALGAAAITHLADGHNDRTISWAGGSIRSLAVITYQGVQ